MGAPCLPVLETWESTNVRSRHSNNKGPRTNLRPRGPFTSHQITLTAPVAAPHAWRGDTLRGTPGDNPPTPAEAPVDCGSAYAPRHSADALRKYRDARHQIRHGSHADQSRYTQAVEEPAVHSRIHNSDARSLQERWALPMHIAKESSSFSDLSQFRTARRLGSMAFP
jgi:hypothetical protein